MGIYPLNMLRILRNIAHPEVETVSAHCYTLSVNRGVLGYNLYAVALPDGVDILTINNK